MANFPNSIFSPRALVDRVGAVYDALKTKVFYAKDHNDFGAEIVAIETELGTNPKGVYASVSAYLEALASAVGGIVTDFLGLSDTPSSYDGQGGKVVAVKSDVSGLEFIDPPAGAVDFVDLDDTPASYASQKNKLVKVNAAETALEFISNTILSLLPFPLFPLNSTPVYSEIYSTKTTMRVVLLNFSNDILLNKISFRTAAVGTAGTIKLALFSDDGQTLIFSVQSAALSANAINTVTLASPVFIPSGNYYFCVLPIDTVSFNLYCWYPYSNIPFSTTNGLGTDVTGKPKYYGTITVTADTIPNTITPANITEVFCYPPIARFDN